MLKVCNAGTVIPMAQAVMLGGLGILYLTTTEKKLDREKNDTIEVERKGRKQLGLLV